MHNPGARGAASMLAGHGARVCFRGGAGIDARRVWRAARAVRGFSLELLRIMTEKVVVLSRRGERVGEESEFDGEQCWAVRQSGRCLNSVRPSNHSPPLLPPPVTSPSILTSPFCPWCCGHFPPPPQGRSVSPIKALIPPQPQDSRISCHASVVKVFAPLDRHLSSDVQGPASSPEPTRTGPTMGNIRIENVPHFMTSSKDMALGGRDGRSEGARETGELAREDGRKDMWLLALDPARETQDAAREGARELNGVDPLSRYRSGDL
ncbi:hypothetical protein B0H10DRAFT_1954652 [Mycena sp. CBHHK59/15]|nr:hypothetical protein B0H10DRAFT_1954652 [Mycena sp. CBHHK59/15]